MGVISADTGVRSKEWKERKDKLEEKREGEERRGGAKGGRGQRRVDECRAEQRGKIGEEQSRVEPGPRDAQKAW